MLAKYRSLFESIRKRKQDVATILSILGVCISIHITNRMELQCIFWIYQHPFTGTKPATLCNLKLAATFEIWNWQHKQSASALICRSWSSAAPGAFTSENTVRLRSPYQHSRPNEVVFGCHCDQLRVQWVPYYSPTPSAFPECNMTTLLQPHPGAFPEYNGYPNTVPLLVLSSSTTSTLMLSPLDVQTPRNSLLRQQNVQRDDDLRNSVTYSYWFNCSRSATATGYSTAWVAQLRGKYTTSKYYSLGMNLVSVRAQS